MWSSAPDNLLQWIRSEAPAQPTQTQKSPVIVAQLLRSILSSGIYLLTTGVVVLASLRWKHPHLFGALLTFLVVSELIPPNLGLTPLISDADMVLVPEVFGHIRQEHVQGQFRVLTPRLLHPAPQDVAVKAPNQSIVWLQLHHRMSGMTMSGIATGIQFALDLPVDGLNLRESDEFYRVCTRLPDVDRISLARLLNVRKLMVLNEMPMPGARYDRSFDTRSNYPLLVYDLPDARPRVYVASKSDFVPNQDEALHKLLKFDELPKDSVILEGREGDLRSECPHRSDVRILAYKQQRVLCAVESKTAGYLVLLDSYYPGWRAYVDGREVGILRADYAFRAVSVTSGKHIVDFRYRPWSFFIGLWVTFMTVVFGAWVGIRKLRSLGPS
jgi:hypothetical protein